MAQFAIKTNNLTKTYKHKNVVDNVSINVADGDIYGLVGKNGAGKTTLLRLLTGLTMPNGGDMELFGEHTLKNLSDMRKRIGCIIENPSLFPYLSAHDNLEYYKIQRGITEKGCVEKNLMFVGLDPKDKKKFKNYSMGMKQRLGLALAIMADPDLLILDEPINGLDPTGIVEFREILQRLNRERHTTIIISSHLLGELSQIANKYGFINQGKLVEEIKAVNLSEKVKQCVSIKVDNGPKASVTLENELNCVNYEVFNGNTIRIYEYLDSPNILVDIFIKNGISVYEVSRVGANLEDYFMNLVGGNHNA